MIIIGLSLFYLVVYFYWSWQRSDYNHINQTISELGESGSKVEKGVAYTFFLPVGLVLLYLCFQSLSNQYVAMLFGAVAIGYIGAAFFPIDKGAPVSNGTWKNGLHNLFGGVEYIGALAALNYLKPELGLLSTLVQAAIVIFVIGLYIPLLRQYRGLLQRVAEMALFFVLWKVL